jgi:hypothetical protein
VLLDTAESTFQSGKTYPLQGRSLALLARAGGPR